MIKERILQCLLNIGCIFIEDGDERLIDVIDDSIMFISFVVELEEEFKVDIPEDFIVMDKFETIEDVSEFLNTIGVL